jgi:hypothetical protein
MYCCLCIPFISYLDQIRIVDIYLLVDGIIELEPPQPSVGINSKPNWKFPSFGCTARADREASVGNTFDPNRKFASSFSLLSSRGRRQRPSAGISSSLNRQFGFFKKRKHIYVPAGPGLYIYVLACVWAFLHFVSPTDLVRSTLARACTRCIYGPQTQAVVTKTRL